MNNREREMWVNNSEPLYKWWKSTKLSMRGFLKQHRNRIDHYIGAFLAKGSSDHIKYPGWPK